MTPEELLEFCQKEQFEANITLEQVSDLIEMFNSLEFPEEKTISYITFCNIIFNKNYNSIFENKKQQIYQPMTQPLSQYFIKSINSQQLQSTPEEIIFHYQKALRFGYRYFEMDCWDGSSGDPNLFPSHTNKIITCEELLKIIATYAFENNSYPLILGLNIQCGEQQQNRLAELIQKYLGKQLYNLPEGCAEMNNLPSPEYLQNKILLYSYGDFKLAQKQIQGENIEINIENKQFAKFGSKGVNNNLLNKLCLFGKKSGFKSNSSSSAFNINCVSVKNLNKYLETKEAQLINFSKKQMSRIVQLDKEKDMINPFDGFLSGSQIVCIGDSTNKIDLLFYESKFQENGGINSGYILKPSFMRADYMGNVCPSLDFQAVKLEIDLNIISCHQIISLAEQSIKTFTLEISMISGRNNDSQKFVSQPLMSDGFRMEFSNFIAKFKIFCPELTMIIFQLKEEDKLFAFYGIPSQCIRNGFRVIPLRNPNTLEILENSTIFASIQVKEIK